MQVSNDLMRVLMLIAYVENYNRTSYEELATVKTPNGVPYTITEEDGETTVRYGEHTVTFETFGWGVDGVLYTVSDKHPTVELYACHYYWGYCGDGKIEYGTIERSWLDRATSTVYEIGGVPVLKMGTKWDWRVVEPETERTEPVPHTTIEFLV